MATNALARPWRRTAVGEVLASAAFGLGALLLAGEAAVHVQQYFALVHGVRWIGALFLANAIACVVAIAGIAYPRTRELAALAGVAISSLALAGLVVSYGRGLFGFREAGFRTAIEVAVLTEIGAVIVLCTAIAAAMYRGSAAGE